MALESDYNLRLVGFFMGNSDFRNKHICWRELMGFITKKFHHIGPGNICVNCELHTEDRQK